MTWRVLVTGSRDWDRNDIIAFQLGLAVGNSPDDVLVIHGACPSGADAIAEQLCQQHGIPTEKHPARWDLYGKPAGFVRNEEMVQAGADLCLAFIKNNSNGASGCAHLAEKAGIPVRRFTDGPAEHS